MSCIIRHHVAHRQLSLSIWWYLIREKYMTFNNMLYENCMNNLQNQNANNLRIAILLTLSMLCISYKPLFLVYSKLGFRSVI